jgi:hypothetical protein
LLFGLDIADHLPALDLPGDDDLLALILVHMLDGAAALRLLLRHQCAGRHAQQKRQQNDRCGSTHENTPTEQTGTPICLAATCRKILAFAGQICRKM